MPRRTSIAVSSICLAAALSLPLSAFAQSNPGFYPQRFTACHEEGAEKPLLPELPSPVAGLIPLPRKKAPLTLEIARLEVIDVPVVEPVPAHAPHSAAPPPVKVVLVEGENDFHCIGFTRGRAGILRVLEAPAGARFAHHSDPQSWRLVNFRAAGAIGMKDAIPALRRELARPIPKGPADHTTFDLLDGKLHAMRALADLGDKESVPRMASYLQSREDESYSLIWIDSLEPIARLDKDAAQSYAIALIRRIAEGRRKPTDPDAASDDTMVREALPLLTKRSAADLAVLQKITADTEGHSSRWHDACEVLAARIRLGDDALRKEMRAELSTDLRTNRATVCYSQVMPVAFPGEDPDEVDTLLFRWRHEEMLNLLDKARSLAKDGKLDARWKEAQKKILQWLHKHLNDPRIAGGKSDTRFSGEDRALHLTALAALGDAQGKAALDKLIEDPNDDSAWPWLAAYQALRFDLAGAADRAETRLRWAIANSTRRYSTRSDPKRGPLLVNDHVRVIDALAARGDARFSLGLLDSERWGREAAAVHLAKALPAAACDLVAGAARTARGASAFGDPVSDALWALSLLGDTCKPAMWKALQDTTNPPEVRGMALEVLAMMRDPRVAGMLGSADKRDKLRPARERAKIIFHAKE